MWLFAYCGSRNSGNPYERHGESILYTLGVLTYNFNMSRVHGNLIYSLGKLFHSMVGSITRRTTTVRSIGGKQS